MAVYRPVIPPEVAERIRHLSPDLKRGIREAIRAIATDPARGDPLERDLREYRKYKVRRYRIVYRVERSARELRILAIGHRRSVYEEAAERKRSRQEKDATSPAFFPPVARKSSRRRAVRRR